MKFKYFIILVFISSCVSTGNDLPVIEDREKCVIISEEFVLSKVKFPKETEVKYSTAVFENSGESSTVLNQFTTKNAFGVKTSGVYKIVLKFSDGDWTDKNNWEYSSFIIEMNSGEKYFY